MTEQSELLAHFQRMMSAAANYIEPTTYIARHPSGENVKWNTEFPEPDQHASASGAEATKRRRDQAFISDMLYMLDGPEQRQALAAQPRDDVRERKPVAWRYEYSVQYKNKLECTKNLAPLSILSEHRWSPEEARNYSETPLYTALATTTQPDTDSGLAGEMEALAQRCQNARHSAAGAEERDNALRDAALALRQVACTDRKAVLEEAAKVAEDLGQQGISDSDNPLGCEFNRIAGIAAHKIADAIRARKGGGA